MTVGLLSLCGSPSYLPSQRNILNMNFTFDNEYPLINGLLFNTINPTLNGASPFDKFSLSPYPQQIDQNGYINNSGASGQNVKGANTFPASSNFPGSWVLTWDGDGHLSFDTFNGGDTFTWTEANLVTAGTGTFTNGSASISFTNSFSADQQVVFSSSGTLPTNFSINTVYYVIATGLSGSAFQVSATKGGAAIVAGSAGSGTQTVNGTYTRNSNGSWTNRAGIKAYIVFALSGKTTPGAINLTYSSTGGTPVSVSSYSWSSGTLTVNTSAHGRQVGSTPWMTFQGSSSAALANATFQCAITSATQFTCQIAADPTPIVTPGTFTAFATNVQVYRQADEADLLAGKIFRSQWKTEVVGLNPSAVRFMNWTGGNSGLAYSFLDRTTPNLVNWNCGATSYNWTAGPAYGRLSGYTAWTLAAVSTGTPSNPRTTPASMTHGEIVVAQIAQSGTMGAGPQVAVSSIQLQASPTVTTAGNHNLFQGDKIWFTADTGMTQINGGNANGNTNNGGFCTVTSITNSTQFIIDRDTTAYSAWSNVATNFFTRSVAAKSSSSLTAGTTTTVTLTNHGFSVGDPVIINGITAGGSWPHLNLFPATVQVVTDANNFTINFNSTGFPSWTGTANVCLYLTLNVGGRGAFPIIFKDGAAAATFGNNYMNEGSYKLFIFDKTIAGQSDGAGNLVLGAWTFDINGLTAGFSNDVPIEICVACVNELNATSVALGNKQPINIYLNTTPYGIDTPDLSLDSPAASSSKLYGSGMVNVALNGANGYAGLTSKAHLFIECSNEPWNTTVVGDYLKYRNQCRWPTSGANDVIDITMLRATGMAIDISNNFPTQTGNSFGQRVHRVLGGAPNQGAGVGTNYYQVWNTGSSTTFYKNDALVTGGSWGAPGAHHEAYNRAPYCTPITSYWNTTAGTGTFTDDSALFNGTDNSGNGGGNYTGAANTTQAIVNFVAQCSIAGAHGTSADGNFYASYTFYTSLISAWMPAGKFYMEYEGGFSWSTKSGNKNANHTNTANDQNFLLAVSNSAAWGVAQTAYFNAIALLPGVGMPAVYIINSGSATEQQFAYCGADVYASGVEGQALLNNGAWAAMSTRNAGLS